MTFGLGFEAQAEFHWFESLGGDLSEQKESQEGRWKDHKQLNPTAWEEGLGFCGLLGHTP